MQTFTPYSDFEATARALDTKRLGKQRVEVIQIVRALTVPGYAWASHPAVLMWKGYEEALGRYGLTMCEVWTERGFGDTCAGTIIQDLRTFGIESVRGVGELAAAGACQVGCSIPNCCAATSPRWCARIPSITDSGSPMCPTTWTMSGRSAPRW
jgi:hypothetical protein